MAAGIALVEYSRAQYVQPITGIRVINKCTKIVFVAMWYGPYGAGSQQVVPERASTFGSSNVGPGSLALHLVGVRGLPGCHLEAYSLTFCVMRQKVV